MSRQAVALSLVIVLLAALSTHAVWAQEAEPGADPWVDPSLPQVATEWPEGTPTIDTSNLQFTPAEIQIAPNETVVWSNASPFGHTVSSDDGLFDSGYLEPGVAFGLTFPTPGRYQYYCIPHGSPNMGGMSGVVIVAEPPPAAPVEDPGTVYQEPAPASEDPGGLYGDLGY